MTSDFQAGYFGEFRRMWTQANTTKAVVYIKPGQAEQGNEVELNLNGYKSKFWVNLSSMTVDELLALKRVIDLSFEAAVETCRMRDEAGEVALADGDISHARCFRQPPIIWKREGEVFSDTVCTLPDNWEGDNEYAKLFEKVVTSKAPKVDDTVVELDETNRHGRE